MREKLVQAMTAVFLIAAHSIEAVAQASPDVEKKFQNFAINNLQEKIYAHLNRTDHIAGEILWFKIYCVDDRHHHALDLSKIAYVEIVDGDNRPVLQTKLSLRNGEGAGSFYIPAT